jgi:hypothetical protein
MTLEQIEQAELEAYLKEEARIDALPLIKGYCFMCEYYNCDCEDSK